MLLQSLPNQTPGIISRSAAYNDVVYLWMLNIKLAAPQFPMQPTGQQPPWCCPLDSSWNWTNWVRVLWGAWWTSICRDAAIKAAVEKVQALLNFKLGCSHVICRTASYTNPTSKAPGEKLAVLWNMFTAHCKCLTATPAIDTFSTALKTPEPEHSITPRPWNFDHH